jgi:hypothetical protein
VRGGRQAAPMRLIVGLLLVSGVGLSGCTLESTCASHFANEEEQVACLQGAGAVAETILMNQPDIARSARDIEAGCRKGCVEIYNPDALQGLPDAEFQRTLDRVIREYNACEESCVIRIREGDLL